MICGEAVQQLAERITIEQRRANQPQVFHREYALVDQRLFDDREAEAAGIDKAVAERNGQHHPNSIAPIDVIDSGAWSGRAC